MGINLPAFQHGQATVSGATTATQLDDYPIPDHYRVVVKALDENTVPIYIGNSASLTDDNGFELTKNSAVKLNVTNLNLIWIYSTAASQQISWISEALD